MRRDYVPPRQRCVPTIWAQVWARLFPPSYHDPEFPWPIPYELGLRWGADRHLRRIGELSWERWWRHLLWDLRAVVAAVAICVALVAIGDALAHLVSWCLR